jgi:hypothetical protein
MIWLTFDISYTAELTFLQNLNDPMDSHPLSGKGV